MKRTAKQLNSLVNFTSGSAGEPKVVATTHRSVIDFIDAFDTEFGFDRDDVFADQAPFDFDFCTVNPA